MSDKYVNWVNIAISIGIKPESLDKVFEPWILENIQIDGPRFRPIRIHLLAPTIHRHFSTRYHSCYNKVLPEQIAATNDSPKVLQKNTYLSRSIPMPVFVE
jgi:hypothetical protein